MMATDIGEELSRQKKAWEEYRFLSNELLKFSKEEDIDMINRLISERDKMQELIENFPEQLYTETQEGQKTKSDIILANKKIAMALQRNINFLKHALDVSDAYGNPSTGVLGGGNTMDFGV